MGYRRGGLYSYDMTRRMLLGLKRRAEALRATRLHDVQATRRAVA